MQRGLVVGVLAVLLLIIPFVPSWDPPVGDPATVNWLTVIFLVAVILVILLVASHHGIFWRTFLHPENARQAVWLSVGVFIVAWPAEGALLIAFFVTGFLSQCGDGNMYQQHACSAGENMGKYLVGLVFKGCFLLMQIVAVVAAIALIRALILLAVARFIRSSARSTQDAAVVRWRDGV